MGRLFGWVLMLVAIYIAITIFTEGLDHAFWGIFSSSEPTAVAPHSSGDDPQAAPGPVPITQRVKGIVEGHYESSARRRERALER